MPVTIRDQRADDAEAVAAVLGLAFAAEPEVVGLEAALGRRDDSRGYVAVEGASVVGHVRLTRGWIDASERLVDAVVLSPLSVTPDLQGRGIGTALLAHAVEAAAALGAPAVFLEGDPGYYGRLGWRPAAEIGVEAPSERIPAPAFQVVTLPAYEPWMRGRFVYPETFWAHDCVGLRGDVLTAVRTALGLDERDSAEAVIGLEEELLTPEVRADRDRVAALLHPDFVEFGSSGREWDRAGIISALAEDPGDRRRMVDARVTPMSSYSVLLTYRVLGDPGSLRSSVWQREADGRWRLRFHQGTAAMRRST